MRIISGKFRGHQLVSFKASHIRPTTDRVKETIFNKLMRETSDARVLDLYAGTGNLGLEALSRGASYVQFVELNKKSISILKQNINKLGVSNEVTVISKDVCKFLREDNSPFDIILIDPPFTKKLADVTMRTLAHSTVIQSGTLVVIESSAHEPISDGYESVKLLDRKHFGDKNLSIFRVES